MRQVLCICLVWLARSSLFGQLSPQFLMFGDTASNNRGAALVRTANNGVWYAGTAQQSTDDVFLCRIHEGGDLAWQVMLGTNDQEFVNNMKAYDADKLMICGDATDGLGNVDGFLMMVDTSGELLWRSDHGTVEKNEDFYGIHKANNGDILVAGFSSGSSGEGNDLLVARYDAEGNQLWRTTWGDAVNDYAMGITETPGGMVFISGDRWIEGIGYNAMVAAISSEGEVMWEQVLELPYNGGCKTLLLNHAGKLILTGESGTEFSPVFDVLIAQVDTTGVIDWVNWIGDTKGGEAGYDIAETAMGTYYITGFGYNALTGNNDILVVHADAAGMELGRRYFGEDLVDYAYDIQTDEAGNYWVAGFTNQTGLTYFAMIRDFFEPYTAISPHHQEISIQVYPNPTQDYLYLKASGGHGFDAILWNSHSVPVRRWDHLSGTEILPIADLPAGMYLLECIGQMDSFRKWVQVVKP
jgi:hypothetical protein